MLRLGTATARAASRHLASRRVPRAAPALQSFHAGLPRREESKASNAVQTQKTLLTPALVIDKLGLDDWRRALPIGVFFAIPALSQEWIVLSEETQLLGCFMLFVGTIYAKFGDTIGASLDAQADAILEARNKDEDAQLTLAQEAMDSHTARLGNADITRDLIALQRETMDKEALLKTAMIPHAARDTVVQLLDSMMASQANEWNVAQTDLVNKAVNTVTDQVRSDKKLKKTALDEALAALTQPGKAGGVDAVSGLFVQFFKDTASKARKDASAEQTVTPAERQALIDSIDTQATQFAHIEGISERAAKAKSLIPDKYTGSLAKAFLEAQAKAKGL